MAGNSPAWPRRAALSLALVVSSAPALAQTGGAGGVSWLQVGTLAVLLFLSAFMSGSETALTAIGQWKIRQLREDGQDPHGVFALLERDRTRFITTLLIGNNLVNIAATAIVTQLAINLSGSLGFSQSLAVGYATGLTTLLVLVFGEITPKSVAVHHAVALSRLVIRPVYALSWVLYPVGLFFTFIASSLLRLLRLEPRANPLITENELRLMLRSAEESGVIERQEEEMIKGVIELEETVVREIMTPRVQMAAVPESATLAEFLALTREHSYSRLPVYGDTVDNIRGIAYARTLLEYLRRPQALGEVTVGEVMQPAQYVPETLDVLTLLRDMRQRKNHMAVVVDEFGGTAGLITLEDIIEEITGEIYDETDEDETEDVQVLEPGVFQVQGSVHLGDLGDILDLLPEEDADYDTLAGLLISRFGYIPQRGEWLEHGLYRFEIEEADERRVLSVRVGPKSAPPEPHAEPG